MLVLHLGMPKTGTSVAQQCLATYAREDGARIDYTSIGRDALVAHHPLAQELLTEGAVSPTRRILLDRLQEPGTRPIIVSSERFTNLLGRRHLHILLDFLLACRTHDKIRCVLAIREMASYRESMHLQMGRFGKCTTTIEAHIASGIRGAVGFFGNIGKLRSRLGQDLWCPMVTDGFDSVSQIERAAGVEPDTLGKYRGRVRSTVRYPLKAQTVLLHLDEIAQKTGLVLNRRRLLRALARGVRFEDDTADYTIIPPALADAMSRVALAAAKRSGLQDYVDSFGGKRGKRPPYHSLDIATLSQRDIERAVSLARPTGRREDHRAA